MLAPAIVGLVAIGLARRGAPWPIAEQITRGMTVVAAIAAIAVGVQAVQAGSFGQAVSDIQFDLAGLGPSSAPHPEDPDIYLVLLDAYPGSAAAALDPTWDAAAFGDALRSRGFAMADGTHSNYLQTPQTITSVLDMRHLADIPALDPPWGPASLDGYRLRRALNEATALSTLHQRGYELTAIASGWAEAELRRVDRYIEPIGLNEFEVGLLRGTGAGDVLTFLAPDLAAALQRGRIRCSFESLAAEAARQSERPKFVFAHIAAPHPPWVFDAAGNDRRDQLRTYYQDGARDRGIDRSDAIRLHLDQATYTAGLTLAAVDEILSTADSPPVIIIFSDHGPGTGFDPSKPLESDLVERSSNILAVYSPGHSGLFASPTTPVNILPRVFNAYLGTDDSRTVRRDVRVARIAARHDCRRSVEPGTRAVMSETGAEAGVPAAPAAPADPAAEVGPAEPVRRRLPPDSWWPIAWYPIAFPVAYVIAIWSASAIHPSWLVRPLVATIAAVLLLTLLLSALLRDRHRGGLAASTITLALLLSDERVRIILVLLTVVIIGDALLHRGRRWPSGRRVTRFMSILGATLILVVVLSTVQQGSFQAAVGDVQADLRARHADAFDPAAPDIYVVLLDAYPGDDAAALDPTFDADAFPSALVERGFEVERHARANYLTTRLTVATMLADQHVEAAPELDPPLGNQAADARRLREFGDDGMVFERFATRASRPSP